MQPLFANQLCGLPRQGEGDGRFLCLKIGGIVSEDATSTGLLPKLSGEAVIVIVDFAP
jgi:hypothetical protein